MNREQRRNMSKQLKSKGYNYNTDKLISILNKTDEKYLKEGTKVKLNIDRIKSQPDYNKDLDTNKSRYHAWIEQNKDTVFTVEYDPRYGDSPSIVCLGKDSIQQKWTFWVGDLIEVKE